jgi:hypothetical protein
MNPASAGFLHLGGAEGLRAPAWLPTSQHSSNAGTAQANGGYDDPGNGRNLIDVEVHARLADSLSDTDTSDNNGLDSPFAKAAVGKRTLFVEPVKTAQQATAP